MNLGGEKTITELIKYVLSQDLLFCLKDRKHVAASGWFAYDWVSSISLFTWIMRKVLISFAANMIRQMGGYFKQQKRESGSILVPPNFSKATNNFSLRYIFRSENSTYPGFKKNTNKFAIWFLTNFLKNPCKITQDISWYLWKGTEYKAELRACHQRESGRWI